MRSAERDGAFPEGLELAPVSRRPTVLRPQTVATVLAATTERLRPRAKPDAAPDATIAIVAYDGLAFTRLCLESVLANTEAPEYEVVVVDNGSGDGSAAYLDELAARFPHVRVLRNERNLGFAPAANQALAAARGTALVLLNNDTIVPPGWLVRLVDHLSDPGAGLVGPPTNRIGTEAEIEAPYGTYGELLAFARHRAEEHAGETRQLRLPAMFCVAFRRELYERIGPLDERYEVGNFEDEDYAMRCRAAGYSTLCAEDVFVHHFGEGSFGQLFANGERGRLFRANRQRFEEKWGARWAPVVRRPSPEYDELRERIRAAAVEAFPPGAAVAVVSRGDPQLLELGGGAGRHFPRLEDGAWSAAYPADSTDAIAQLEEARIDGARFLLVPATGFWWLEHYDGLRRHLERNYRVSLQRDDTCLIYEL